MANLTMRKWQLCAADAQTNMVTAVIAYETFKAVAFDGALVAKLNGRGMGRTLIVVINSLHKDALQSVSRIWDNEDRASSLKFILGEFKNEQRAAEVLSTWHGKDVPVAKVRRWKAQARQVQHSEVFKRVVHVRHTMIAHTAKTVLDADGVPVVPTTKKASHRDVTSIIDKTAPVVASLLELLMMPNDGGFDSYKENFSTSAERFWRVAAGLRKTGRESE